MGISVANYQILPTDPDGEMIGYFNRKFGVKLTVFNFDNQYFQEQLNLKIAAGSVPDFLYLRQASSLATYVKLGILAPVPLDKFQKFAPRLYRALQTYAPGYLEMGKMDGCLYGIPVVNPTNQFHVPLVYRQDWLEAVGIHQPPQTLGEFEDLMYRWVKSGTIGPGKTKIYGLSRDGLNAVFGAYGLVPMEDQTEYWIREEGRLVNCSVSARAKQALALLARWYQDGIIDPEFVTGENKGGYWALSQAFLEGRIGFTTHGNFYHWTTTGSYAVTLSQGKKMPCSAESNGKVWEKVHPGVRLVMGPALAGPGGRGIKAYNRLMNFVTFSRESALVPGKLEKMLQILDANASDDPLERWGMHLGIEGKHWKLLDRSTEAIKILPPWDKEEGYWSRIGCVLSIDVPLPSQSPRDRWAWSLGLDKDGIYSLIQVGLPSSSRLEPKLRALRNEAYLGIITGRSPVNSFDAFVREYMAEGGAVLQREAEDYLRDHR